MSKLFKKLNARLIFAWIAATSLVMAADPLAGTWKLNPAQSTPGWNETVRLDELQHGQMRMTMSRKLPAGSVRNTVVTFRFDGKPYPGSNGDEGRFKRINLNQAEVQHTKTGTCLKLDYQWSLSAEGRTLTMNVTGQGPNCKARSGKGVYVKQ